MPDPDAGRGSGTAVVSDGHSAGGQLRSAAGAVLVALIVGEWYQQRAAPLRWRVALAGVVGAATIALFVWLRPLPRSARWPALIGLVLSIGLAAAVGVTTSTVGLLYDVARHVVPTTLGWIGATLLISRGRSEAHPYLTRAPRPVPEILLVAGFAFAVILLVVPFGYAWFEVDETLYAVQAGRFRQLSMVQPVDSTLLPFFLPPQSFPAPGGFVTQYPPGWPAILTILSALGLRPVAGAILGAITVACVYQIGREIHSREAGLIGGVLLATQSLFLDQGASYWSHMACMALLCGAALLLLRANRSGSWRPAVGAGFLLGVALTSRPFTAVLLGGSIWLWSGLMTSSGIRRMTTVTMWAAIGGIGPLLALLAYNNALTGDPLTFGYSKLHGNLHGFGFGERGWAQYDSSLNPTRTTMLFTPAAAVRDYLVALWSYARYTLPLCLAMPAVALAISRGVRFRWVVIAVFLPLPVITFFYFGDTMRLMIEILPFVFVGFGTLFATMYSLGMLRRGALAALLVAQMAGSALVLRDVYARQLDGYSGSGFRFMKEVAAYREQRGPILVFVREPDAYPIWFMSLNWYNADGFPGDIIVARDLGPENVRLAQRFPSHLPVLVTRSRGDVPPLVDLRLTPDSTRAP